MALPATRFERSVARIEDLPPPGMPEIAFAGRSNAGKSSAINALVHHARLAFVSKTPGRTQLINFFRCGDRGFLVDLPGYGYAQVPESVRRGWQGSLEHYLRRRRALAGLVLIMDARHPLTPLDRQMLDWFSPTRRPVHGLLTKSDKLSRGEAALTLRNVRRELAQYPGATSVQLFSSLKKTGLDEAEAVILAWFEGQGGKNEAPG